MRCNPSSSNCGRECGLQPATLSKFEAGLMAAGLSIPGLPDLGPVGVSPDSTLGELAYRVLRREASAMLAHVPGTRLGEDIESLHQMRVATRRMRAGMDMFAAVLPVRAGRLRAELGWLAALLGEVRDLDIQLGRFDDWTEEMPGDHREALDELADLLAGHRCAGETGAARGLGLTALTSGWCRVWWRCSYRVLPSPVRLLVVRRSDDDAGVDRRQAPCRGERPPRAKRTAQQPNYHRAAHSLQEARYALQFASGLYDGDEGLRAPDEPPPGRAGLDAGCRSSPLLALQVIALTEEGALLLGAAIFAMGGVARQYRSEAEHLLGDMPELVQLLRGKEWKRARSLMELRQKAAAPLVARPAAASSRTRRIVVAGRARPALANDASGPVAASRPGVPPRPGPEPEPQTTDEEPGLASDGESTPVTAGESAPRAAPDGENGSTRPRLNSSAQPSR